MYGLFVACVMLVLLVCSAETLCTLNGKFVLFDCCLLCIQIQPSLLHVTVPEQLQSYDVQTLVECQQQLQEFLSV